MEPAPCRGRRACRPVGGSAAANVPPEAGGNRSNRPLRQLKIGTGGFRPLAFLPRHRPLTLPEQPHPGAVPFFQPPGTRLPGSGVRRQAIGWCGLALSALKGGCPMEHPAGAGIEPAYAIPAILPDFHRHGFRGQCRATSVLTHLHWRFPKGARRPFRRWWGRPDSNRHPLGCPAPALSFELPPHVPAPHLRGGISPFSCPASPVSPGSSKPRSWAVSCIRP